MAPLPASASTPDGPLLALVEAARRGDRSAFASLHARHVRLVRGVILVRSGARDLDDITQEVFARALERLHQLRDAAAFVPWLLQIARHETSRERRRPRPEALAHDVPVNDGPRAEAERVLELIRTLPEAHAQPLVLRLVFGMSGSEIATQLDLSPGYVRVALHRGMAQLRELLDADRPSSAMATTAAPHLDEDTNHDP